MVICLVFVGANIIKFGAASAANVGPQYAAEGVAKYLVSVPLRDGFGHGDIRMDESRGG